jgi:hypothetical protein
MERHRMGPPDPETERLIGASWAELTESQREAALRLAREEGRRAVREYLGVVSTKPVSAVTLRRSRWARQHGGLDALPDHVLYLYACARTFPSEDRYAEAVVERFCPGRAWWWGSEPEERCADPRLCAFCDAYERDRCPILGINPPPTEISDLQIQLWEAKEEEREQARRWLHALETSYSTEEYAETQRGAAKLEYLRCQGATDVSQMLLEAAACPDRRQPGRRAA